MYMIMMVMMKEKREREITTKVIHINRSAWGGNEGGGG